MVYKQVWLQLNVTYINVLTRQLNDVFIVLLVIFSFILY